MSGRWTVLLLALSVTRLTSANDDLAGFGKLVLSHVVIRNGARSPMATYPGDPVTEEQWGDKLGETTPLGLHEQYEVGMFLRDRYADFLPLVYNTDDVLVRCSDVDHVITSTMSVVNGLYPMLRRPGQSANVYQQQVPLHMTPQQYDMLLPTSVSPCPNFLEESEIANSTDEYRRFQDEKRRIENLVLGIAVASAAVVHDTFNSKAYHGLPLPDWSRGLFPEPLNSYNNFNLFFRAGCTGPIRRMLAGKLVNETIEHMQMKIKNTLQPDRKLFIYGTHSSNMVALLSAMDVWNGMTAQFSSCLMIELRRNKHHEHIVMVSYKNDTSQPPHLLHLPGCRTVACSFQEFFTALVSEIFDEAECYGESTQSHSHVIHLPDSQFHNQQVHAIAH